MKVKRKLAAMLAAAMVLTGQPAGYLAEGIHNGLSAYAAEKDAEKLASESEADEAEEATGSEAEEGSGSAGGSGNGGSSEVPKEEQEKFTVAYHVEPEEGAKIIDKDRTVKTGETLEFTVRVNEGYEIDYVDVSGDDVEPAKEDEEKREYRYEVENVMQEPEVNVYLLDLEALEELDLMTLEEATPSEAVYVSSSGDDETGDGTEEEPFATLAKAVGDEEKGGVKDGGTVYLLSDITMNQSARVIDKSVTIDGQGHTVTRGNVGQVQDSARSTYNPALFEINNWGTNDEITLTFTNITIDDDGKVAGTDYSQQSTDGTYGNEDKVQDGIIAAYTDTNEIILGEGTTLQNYGGMSAVRITAGATLTMEGGSQIIDTESIERGNTTSEENLDGQAGAVWIQSGIFEMEGGSVIGGLENETMVGRAVYIDGGEATINGEISDLKASSKMWQGENGVAIHVRNGAQAVLGGTGVIDTISGTEEKGGAIRTDGSANEGYGFTTEQDSVIKNVTGFPVLYSNYGTELLKGTIEECTNNFIIGGFAQNTTIGPTGVIQNCVSTSGPARAIVYTSNASKVYMNGTMKDNDASYAFYIINQSGGGASLEMNEGAVVTGTGKNTGVYVNASECKFTMNGGTISNFSTGVNIRGKSGRDATFIMNGGTITGNSSYGVNFNGISNSESIVDLNGGTIEGNGSCEVYAYGGNSNDTNERTKIAADVIKGSRTVQVSAGTVTLDEGYADVSLGNAQSVAVNKIKELLKAGEATNDWTVAGSSALYIQPSTAEYHFQITAPYSVKPTGLFVTYIPLKEDGTPADDAKLLGMDEVANEDTLDVTMHDLTAGTAYALMFVNNNTYTLAPDDITIYTGGGQDGVETYDDGLPEYTMTDSLETIKTLEVNGEDTGKTGDEALDTLRDKYLTITYTDAETGEPITDDKEAGECIASLMLKNSTAEIRINGNEVEIDPEKTGTLIVRHTQDIDEATNGTNTYPILSETPTTAVEHAEVVIKKPGGWLSSLNYYINNDADRKLKDEEIAGISLLDDSLLEDGNDNRQQLLEEKAEKTAGLLPEVAEGDTYKYDFHYLDLVDAYNGNAWIATSGDTTVYLPYPAGTDKNTQFTILHYKDLHREYGISGQAEVEEAIEACEIETVDATFTEVGIQFDVARAGFSPFAIVWPEEAKTVTVNFLDVDTNEEIADPIVETHAKGSNYNVSEVKDKEIKGYEFVRVDDESKLTGESIEENVVINVYYKKIEETPVEPETYTITIKYVSESTGKEIADAVAVTAEEDKTYDVTEQATKAISGYAYVRSEGALTGTAKADVTITSYYKRNSSGGTPSGPSGGSGSGSSYTVGTNGNWVHVDPQDINKAISQQVPEGATPVTSPEWHQWKFVMNTGAMLKSQWAYIKNPYAVEGQPKEAWFYFDGDGIMEYGWFLDTATGKWYYLHRESDGMLGSMETGWHYDDQDGRVYYLNPANGEMLLGWQEIGGKWYYFNPAAPEETWNYNEATGGWTYNGSASRPYGSMYREETTPDGYYVDGNGVWVQNN